MSNFISRWVANRRFQKEMVRYETIMKDYNNARSMQNLLPKSPEILPYPQSGSSIRSMALRVSTLRTVIENLKTETYRRPPTVKPLWEAKCPECGAEYQQHMEFCENPLCTLQGIKAIKPDVEQVNTFNKWEKCVNFNGKSMHDLGKMFLSDILIQDNAWVTVSFDYVVDNVTGEIIAKKPVEFNYARPEVMRLIQNEYGTPGGLYWTCINHRDVLVSADQKLTPCPHDGCHLPLFEVTAISVKLDQAGNQSGKMFVDKPYIAGEWFHKAYFTETYNYGISNIYTLWMKASTLWYMDELENNTFKEGKPPKSMLLFNGYNPAAIMGQMKDELDMASRNRNYIPKLVFPFSEGKTPAMLLNLMPNDNELNVLGRRKEIKEDIGILYGQSAMMIGDMSTGGGLNNEGMQQTTMLRRVEGLEEFMTKSYYRFVMDSIGAVDHKCQFPPPKEEDRMAVLQRRKENISMMGEVLNRGADYIVKNDDDFEFEIVGHMGPLQSGMGFKEMGGSGMELTDWQHTDASFAFSKSMAKFNDIELNNALRELMEDISYMGGSMFDLAWERFVDKFDEYMLRSNARYLRQFIDADIMIEPDVLERLTFNDDYRLAMDKLYIDVKAGVESIESMDSIIQIVQTVNARCENIIRTEAQAIVNLGRAEMYRVDDPSDEIYDYDWVGPDYVPGRSTKCCVAIKRDFDKVRAEKGRVSLADAEEIVNYHSCIEHGDEKAFCLGRPWNPHYNCRFNLVGQQFSGMEKALVFISDPNHAPPGAKIITGPRGGTYYDPADVGSDKDPADDEEDPETTNEETEPESEFGDGSGDGEEKGVAIQDEKDPKVFHIKLFDASQLKDVEGKMEGAGYKLLDPEKLEVIEAVKG